jgi:serine phosphatase RsbU (regulator of sigma subunit)
VLRRVNETLRRASPDRFCTVTYLRITPGPGAATVTSVCAGHSPPLIATADACESVPSAGTLLGAFREIELRPVRSTVPAGALLAVYTDGCTEARAADGTFFGDDGIRAALRAAARDGTDDPAADLCERVLAFQDGNPRDDIAIVVATPQPPFPGTMRYAS